MNEAPKQRLGHWLEEAIMGKEQWGHRDVSHTYLTTALIASSRRGVIGIEGRAYTPGKVFYRHF